MTELDEALAYAAQIRNRGRDMRPLLNMLQQHIRVLGAEVARLRELAESAIKDQAHWRTKAQEYSAAYDGAEAEVERLKAEISVWAHTIAEQETELLRRETEYQARADALTQEVQALKSENAALHRDREHPRP